MAFFARFGRHVQKRADDFDAEALLPSYELGVSEWKRRAKNSRRLICDRQTNAALDALHGLCLGVPDGYAILGARAVELSEHLPKCTVEDLNKVYCTLLQVEAGGQLQLYAASGSVFACDLSALGATRW